MAGGRGFARKAQCGQRTEKIQKMKNIVSQNVGCSIERKESTGPTNGPGKVCTIPGGTEGQGHFIAGIHVPFTLWAVPAFSASALLTSGAR